MNLRPLKNFWIQADKIFVQPTHLRFNACLISLSFFFLFLGNQLVSLTHPDEVFYAQSAKEMIKYKSWITPHLFDYPQFEKPILFYWLLIVAFKGFGVNAFAARFWPAIFGMIGVIITYWLSFILFHNKRISFWAGIILCTSSIYLALSRAALTDMVFSTWILLSLAAFYWGYTYTRHRNLGTILCCIFSALAVLTKGLLGLVIPLGVILLFLTYERNISYLKSKAWAVGLFLFSAIAIPWHLLMVQLYGHRFIDEYLYNVHIHRIFEAEHTKNNTWYFYLMVLFLGVFPWSFLLIGTGYRILKNFPPDKDYKRSFLFLGSWIIFVYIIVQSAQSKLASYIFPVFPALAIILAYYFDQRERVAGRRPLVMISSSCIFTMTVLLILFGVCSYAEPWVSCKSTAEVLMRLDSSDSAILVSKPYVRGIRFYTDRKIATMDMNGKDFFSPHPIPFLNTDQEVLQFLRNQPMTYCVVHKSGVKDLERIIPLKDFHVDYLDQIGDKYIT